MPDRASQRASPSDRAKTTVSAACGMRPKGRFGNGTRSQRYQGRLGYGFRHLSRNALGPASTALTRSDVLGSPAISGCGAASPEVEPPARVGRWPYHPEAAATPVGSLLRPLSCQSLVDLGCRRILLLRDVLLDCVVPRLTDRALLLTGPRCLGDRALNRCRRRSPQGRQARATRLRNRGNSSTLW